MAKQPYIPFYLGDYIKDTRILPLNVRGAWVDLILYMWDSKEKGELKGTIEDFSRMMGCSVQEAESCINLLNQKNIFDYEDLGNGVFKIISRKQKKMDELSKIRKKVGKKGGNPILVNQTNSLLNQKDNLNPEYEYENNKVNTVNTLTSNNIAPEMFKIFQKHNPTYPADKTKDFSACLQIAYKIAEGKGWDKSEVLNGKKNEVMKSWEKIVLFTTTDNWFSKRALYDLSNEWQRLIQSMNGVKNISSKPEIAGAPIKKESEVDFEKYKKR